MILARVIGNVVASQKNERYANARMMLCQPLTLEGAETGATLLALDSVDAGVGDVVLIVQEGWGASTAATGEPGAAIDSAIVGVVDRIRKLDAALGSSGDAGLVTMAPLDWLRVPDLAATQVQDTPSSLSVSPSKCTTRR